METGFMNRIIGLVIALVVGGLLVGGLLIPSIEAMTTTEKTFANTEGYYRMAEMTESDANEYTLEWVKSSTTILTINGEDFDANASYGRAITTIIAADEWLIRYDSIDSAAGYVRFFDGTTGVGDTTTKSFDITASNGSATIEIVNSDDTTTTKTVSYTKLYVIDPKSTDDIMKKSTATPYILGDSNLFAMGSTTGIPGIISIDGTINDGVDIEVIGTEGEIISNVVIHKTAVAGYKDLYIISEVTFDVEIEGVTTSATYNYFIVPYKVTAELSQHLDATQIAMFGVISILGIVALVVLAANGIRNKY